MLPPTTQLPAHQRGIGEVTRRVWCAVNDRLQNFGRALPHHVVRDNAAGRPIYGRDDVGLRFFEPTKVNSSSSSTTSGTAAICSEGGKEAWYELILVWARLGSRESSINVLRRAADVAETVGAQASAGLALVALIEEHGAHRALQPPDAYAAYMRADALLRGTQDADDVARLRSCADVVMRRLAGMRIKERNFTLHGAVHELEARIIAEALAEAGGSVTKAARLLGLPHQTLGTMLNTRHKTLLPKRAPAKKRKRSIIQKPEE